MKSLHVLVIKDDTAASVVLRVLRPVRKTNNVSRNGRRAVFKTVPVYIKLFVPIANGKNETVRSDSWLT